jgi:uncharacterized repeat protein (TIGR01451 family)
MDTSCSQVVTATIVNCGNSGIVNLDGIQYFDNLQELSCANFSGTPIAKKLLQIPAFPPLLNKFHSTYNEFTSLPALPATLQTLSSYGGKLAALPQLPAALETLRCHDNLLTALPTLTPLLKILYCQDNNLPLLPSLPNSLLTLNCSNNLISSLPTLPSTMRELWCSSLPGLALPVLPDSLRTFVCDYNNWSSLPALPDSLTDFTCYHNQLTVIPPLPPAIEFVGISYNPLISFPAIPVTVETLICDSINLQSLPNPLPPFLTNLHCSYNPLTSIPDLPPTLNIFYCASTLISELPDLNPQMYSVEIPDNPNLICMPWYQELQFFKWTNTPIQCLPNAGIIVNSAPSIANLPICLPLSGCDFNWSLYGRIYNETISNCNIDSSEQLLRNLKVNLLTGGTVIQSFIFNTGGYYSFLEQNGNYTIELDTVGIPFDIVCPPSGIHTAVLSAADSTAEDLNFGLVCKPGYVDLEAKTGSPFAMLTPGDTALWHLPVGDATLFYGINCSAGTPGVVEAVISGPASYYSEAPGAFVPTTVNGDTITWNVSDFSLVNPYNDFNIMIAINTTALINDEVCINLQVSPLTDSNPANNTSLSCNIIHASFDPNAKENFPSGDIDTSSQWLRYTVFFQNTGNAPADYIYILDTLNASLDHNTFQFLSSSHDPVVELSQSGAVKFSFPNINLPDSNSNEPLSHGFVTYKIKSKSSITPGTQISNTAYIYFDFNPAIITNTTTNTVVLPVSISEANDSDYLVYPNPVRNELKIIFNNGSGKVHPIQIRDMLGNVISNLTVKYDYTSSSCTVDVSALASGLYLVTADIPGSPVASFVKQ